MLESGHAKVREFGEDDVGGVARPLIEQHVARRNVAMHHSLLLCRRSIFVFVTAENTQGNHEQVLSVNTGRRATERTITATKQRLRDGDAQDRAPCRAARAVATPRSLARHPNSSDTHALLIDNSIRNIFLLCLGELWQYGSKSRNVYLREPPAANSVTIDNGSKHTP
jgi:hypothetical protein